MGERAPQSGEPTGSRHLSHQEAKQGWPDPEGEDGETTFDYEQAWPAGDIHRRAQPGDQSDPRPTRGED